MAKKSTVTETGQTEDTTTENLPGTTHTPESDDQTAGAGNSAGPAGLLEAAMAELVNQSGCADVAHMVDMAKVGLSLMEVIDVRSREDGPLKDWTPAEDPAEIVGDLCEVIAVLEDKLRFKDRPADSEGKRGFVVLSPIRQNNVLIEINQPIWLTEDEHGELGPAGVIDPVWENGITGADADD